MADTPENPGAPDVSGAPGAGPLPGPLRFAAAVAAVEGLTLAAYAVTIAAYPLVGRTEGVSRPDDVAGPVLAVILLAMAVLVGLVVRGVLHRRAAARVPLFLLQAFTVVAAWPLATGGLAWERVVGVAFIVAAAAVAYVALSPGGAAALDR